MLRYFDYSERHDQIVLVAKADESPVDGRRYASHSVRAPQLLTCWLGRGRFGIWRGQ